MQTLPEARVAPDGSLQAGLRLAAIVQVPPFMLPHSTTGVTGLIIVSCTILLLPFVVALAQRIARRTTPSVLPPQ